MKKCVSCNSKSISQRVFNFNFVDHKNYNKLFNKVIFHRCKLCGIIVSSKKNFLKKFYKNFFNKSYLEARSKTLVPKFKNIPIFKHFIKNEIHNRKNLKMLDFGNPSIEAIKETTNYFQNSKIIAYDVSRKKEFKYFNMKTKTSALFTNDIKNIYEKYDIILIFNVLQYILNLKSFFKLIKKITYKKSKIYTITPSINKNPFFLLLGDEYLKFTDIALKNLFEINLKKKTKILKRQYVSNKSFIITNFNSDQFKTIKDDSDILKKTHDVLFNIKKKANNLNFKKVFIFGTRINSIFINDFVKNVKGFVDDQKNYFKKKKVFYLKNKVDKSIDIILPYKGTKGLFFKKLLIRKKFKKIYQI
jgi:hypothetical protein